MDRLKANSSEREVGGLYIGPVYEACPRNPVTRARGALLSNGALVGYFVASPRRDACL